MVNENYMDCHLEVEYVLISTRVILEEVETDKVRKEKEEENEEFKSWND